MDFHPSNPAQVVESVFQRIHLERMTDLPMLNSELAVAAVEFALQDGKEWRGVLVTPWGINLLLLPATTDWPMPQSHERVFRHYVSGTFAFLGNHEEGLGDYLTCPLIHDARQFADQETAVMTARACLAALDQPPPGQAASATAPADDAKLPASASRRQFLTLGNRR